MPRPRSKPDNRDTPSTVRGEVQVVREYVGGGAVGELAARLDAADLEQHRAAALADQNDREQLLKFDAPLAELSALADLLAEAALLAAGYHRHHHGEWRKARGRQADDD